MNRVRFGIIGVGNMGSAHVEFVKKIDIAELTAVCDVSPAALKRIAPRLTPDCRTFDDAERFFREAPIDAVIVATPHYSHVDLAIRAMAAGKHLIVEKPIAVHKAEAERLLRAAEQYPATVKSAMFNLRTVAVHRKLKQLIDAGEFGAIRRISWIITDWFRSQHYYDSGDWRATWRGEGGGVLLNQCPHQLDLWQWFFGMPMKVRAMAACGKYHRIEVEDEVNACLEYADGKIGNFITTTGEAPGTNRLEIAAERGRVILENGQLSFRRNEIETSVFSRSTAMSFAMPPCWECSIPIQQEPSGHAVVIENLAAAVLRQEPLIAPLEEGIRSLELGNAMLLAGLTGRAVDLPLDAAAYAAELAKLVAASAGTPAARPF